MPAPVASILPIRQPPSPVTDKLDPDGDLFDLEAVEEVPIQQDDDDFEIVLDSDDDAEDDEEASEFARHPTTEFVSPNHAHGGSQETANVVDGDAESQQVRVALNLRQRLEPVLGGDDTRHDALVVADKNRGWRRET